MTKAMDFMIMKAKKDKRTTNLLMILTNSIHTIKLLIMIYLSTKNLLNNKRKTKRAMLAMKTVETKRIMILVEYNINQAMFKTLIIILLIY